MNILEQICNDKLAEIDGLRKEYPLQDLIASPYYLEEGRNIEVNLAQPFIISEFKRRSPTKPNIDLNAKPAEIVSRYEKQGASAISVLTNEKYFGGSSKDFEDIRALTKLPMLRKEFIVDSYQIHETKAIGADFILLIAAALDKEELKDFFDLSVELGLTPLIELHDYEEIKIIPDGAKWIGVNSRNLKTLETDKSRFKDWIGDLPENAIKVAESAIDSAEEIADLHNMGYQAFLIGEAFMKNQIAK